MTDNRDAIFSGDDPFSLARRWLAAAEQTEVNDANAIALATSGPDGMPNVRIVLLKEIEGEGAHGGFIFYSNYESAKGVELAQNPQAAFAVHWKSIRRQMRVRGAVEMVEAAKSDAYYGSRPYQSRIGAWASQQSRPLASRTALVAEAARIAVRFPRQPPRPAHWGGYRIRPLEMEFWADGDFRMHDRFRWTRPSIHSTEWTVTRLSP